MERGTEAFLPNIFGFSCNNGKFLIAIFYKFILKNI